MMKKIVYLLFFLPGLTHARETLQSVTNNGSETTNRIGLDNGAWVQHRNLKFTDSPIDTGTHLLWKGI